MGPKQRDPKHAWTTVRNLATLIWRNRDTHFGPASDLMAKIAEVQQNNAFVPHDKAEIELQMKVTQLHAVFKNLNVSIQNQRAVTPQDWFELQKILEENP